MEAGAQEEGSPVRHPRRWRWGGVALLALVAVPLGSLWLARKPLAMRYADRFLADRHVTARYRIADLGLGRQRLVNVVIGDPAHPDLVADWLEAETALGLHGPYLTGVRAGRVRVRARWVPSASGGKLSLGSIDRLLSSGGGGGGGAVTLPALALAIDDLRARVATPWGLVAAKLVGSGRLDGGFAGKLALTSDRLDAGCVLAAPRLAGEVTTRTGAVRWAGSGETASARCGVASSGYANLNGSGEVTLGRALGWRIDTDLAAQALRHPQGSAARADGRVRLTGGSAGVKGDVTLTGHAVAGRGALADRVTVAGAVTHDPRVTAFDGRLDWTHARPEQAWGVTVGGAGTPVAPLLRRLGVSLDRAAHDVDGTLVGTAATGAQGTRVALRRATLTSASGAHAVLTAGEGAIVWVAGAPWQVAGLLEAGGGGLPAVAIRLDPAQPGVLVGTAKAQPYAADGAAVALTPVRFAYGPAGWRAATTATLSGPLPNGRVDGLTLPLDLRGQGGNVSLAGGCVPVGWARLAVSGLHLDPATLRLCPQGGSLLTVTGNRVDGGATLGATRLTGALGSSPLMLAASGARLHWTGRQFALTGVAATLGAPGKATTLHAATLDGALGPQGVGGSFAGAGGQVGAVPIVMSDAVGRWRFTGGTLAVEAGLTVSDVQAATPRFRPLPVRNVQFTLKGNAITATGQLRAPDAVRRIADLRLTHDLAAGAGGARFTVPDLAFDKALQPDQLTPVTFGVVADVRGTVTGAGAIDWSPAGVTSAGRFATDGTDLAAAFGPVQGIAGAIVFTDLLALESAPGQTFHVREVNPGIAVTDGTVIFQTLRNSRVAVAGARWPFAGGTLSLDPTLLDFSAAAQRRLTFRVAGAAADQFLQQFDFQNLDATGVFDGVLPMVFDASGGRIADGHLQVRAGGGTLAYVGAISQKDVGFWGNLAFQALKSLRYRSLAIQMNGPLAGEMVTEVRFAGISQGRGAQRGGIAGLLVGRLQRLPFVFNIRIRAPFRGLLDSTASFYDPRRLIQRNLPQLIEEQNRRAAPPATPIQPPASETVP